MESCLRKQKRISDPDKSKHQHGAIFVGMIHGLAGSVPYNSINTYWQIRVTLDGIGLSFNV